MKKLIVAGALTAAAIAGPARADLLWSLDSIAPAGPGQWDWTYNLVITTTTERIRQIGTFPSNTVADFAAIIDFPGYVAGSVQWTGADDFQGAFISENLTAGAFFAPGQSDDPSLPNIRVVYSGPNPVFVPPGAPETLGRVRLRTTAGGSIAQNTDFFSQVVTAAAPTTPLYLSGTVAGPIPEPSTYAMLIAGLAGLGFVARRRAKA
jgi:hypothetical protein